MSTMVYHFDNEGFYLGKSPAFVDPLEGTPKLPANATFIPIPDPLPENKEAQWNGTNWTLPTSRTYLAHQAALEREALEQIENEKKVDRLKQIVFYRKEEGKDEKVLGYGIKEINWNYDTNQVVYPEGLNEANSDYVIFDDAHEFTVNDYGISLEKTVENEIVPRDENDVVAETDAVAWIQLRAVRNQKLYETDWTQMADSPLSEMQKVLYQEYRKTLRDLPDETTDPRNPVWPNLP